MDSQAYINLVLSDDIQKIILLNAQQEVYQFILKNHQHPHVALLAEQIEGRQKAKHKLPHWFNGARVVFPPRISMEQCSSELTAIFKSTLVKGNTLVDLTGGFGVDDWAFAQQFHEVVYLEQQGHLAQLAKHNFAQLGCDNVQVLMDDSLTFLTQTNQQFDCIYLDPARRKEAQKVFKLADCEPNVEDILPLLWQKTNQVLIKCSPLLDIDLAAKSLQHLTKVYVVAVENECKELLFLLQKNKEESFDIESVNLKLNGDIDRFVYQKKEEAIAEPSYGKPEAYLFEPNAAILKSGAFKMVAIQFDLVKLHPNSHLYSAAFPCEYFPGRKFKINACLPFSKNHLKKMNLPIKANITTRNFPYSTAEIRKMTHIKDGGDIYLFFTTLIDGSLVVLLTEKQ